MVKFIRFLEQAFFYEFIHYLILPEFRVFLPSGADMYEEYCALLFDNLPSVKIDYDEKSFLPIPIGRNVNFSPELNLSIMNRGNQNLTPSQRLLLQWHYRFGHKGFHLIQRLFRHVPFGSEKFLAAANCKIPKCSICEFSKGHRTSTK